MAERDELAAVEVRAVRRRQLANAVSHGSTRSWTSGRRRWPAALAGAVLALLLVLGVGVTQVVRAQLAANRRAEQDRQRPPVVTSPSPSARPSKTPTRSPSPSRSARPSPRPSASAGRS